MRALQGLYDPSGPGSSSTSDDEGEYGESGENGENGIGEKDAGKVITKIEKAMIILSEVLANGPVVVSEINEIMEEDGIGAKTAQRAKVRIGAVQEYVDGVPVWRLPSSNG